MNTVFLKRPMINANGTMFRYVHLGNIVTRTGSKLMIIGRTHRQDQQWHISSVFKLTAEQVFQALRSGDFYIDVGVQPMVNDYRDAQRAVLNSDGGLLRYDMNKHLITAPLPPIAGPNRGLIDYGEHMLSCSIAQTPEPKKRRTFSQWFRHHFADRP